MPLDPMTIATLVKSGTQILGPLLGGLFGGGEQGPELPSWLGDLLEKEYSERSYEGFAPDKSTFSSSLNAEIENIMAKMGIRKDAFRSEAASRGISGSGEEMAAMYSSVIAPAVSEASAATGRTMMAFEDLSQRGNIAAAGLRGQNLNQLMRFHTTNLGARMTNFQMDEQGRGDFWNSLGRGVGGATNNILDLMMMKKFYPGLFKPATGVV